jgi:beta-lactamase superfamily II metal-dependent hydrolase
MGEIRSARPSDLLERSSEAKPAGPIGCSSFVVPARVSITSFLLPKRPMPTEKPHAFAGYPSRFVHAEPSERSDKVQHLIWGDYVELRGDPSADGWVPVRARRENGFMKAEDLQPERLLEVNFVDIGQGDGCFIVTPDDEWILIDAGEGDNMRRFLSWRFNLRNHPEQIAKMRCAIISHPDSDHYHGFAEIFSSPQFEFGTVFHNGIVERVGDDVLGPRSDADAGGRTFLTDIIGDSDALKTIIDHDEKVKKKLYPNLMRTAHRRGSMVRMLCSEDQFLPGFGEDDRTDHGKRLTVRVLAPIPETGDDGRRRLRWLGDVGKTKNGHSVVLRLDYEGVRMLLGGDLNIPAEEYLLETHAGMPLPAPGDAAARAAFVARARETFQADIAKACHHGSGDFTSLYLEAVNPIVTIISSGDDEPHCHPRPDALGAFGKFGRGERPLIFSTELARSAKENIKNPSLLRAEYRRLVEERDVATGEKREQLGAKIDALLDKLERSIAVYGMINVRTDGERALVAQKLETPRGSTKWDLHQLERGRDGALRYVSKHEPH